MSSDDDGEQDYIDSAAPSDDEDEDDDEEDIQNMVSDELMDEGIADIPAKEPPQVKLSEVNSVKMVTDEKKNKKQPPAATPTKTKTRVKAEPTPAPAAKEIKAPKKRTRESSSSSEPAKPKKKSRPSGKKWDFPTRKNYMSRNHKKIVEKMAKAYASGDVDYDGPMTYITDDEQRAKAIADVANFVAYMARYGPGDAFAKKCKDPLATTPEPTTWGATEDQAELRALFVNSDFGDIVTFLYHYVAPIIPDWKHHEKEDKDAKKPPPPKKADIASFL